MKMKLEITGLDCPNCAAKLSSMIEADEKIMSCKINFLTEKLTVETNIDEEKAYGALLATAKAFSKEIKIEK